MLSRLYFYSRCFNYNVNTSFLPFPFLPPNLLILVPSLPLILIASFTYYCYKHRGRNKYTY